MQSEMVRVMVKVQSEMVRVMVKVDNAARAMVQELKDATANRMTA